MSKLKKALEKAKNEYADIQFHHPEKVNVFHPPTADEKPALRRETPDDISLSRREVNVSYSNTQVQPVSHDLLRKSKIFALFSAFKINDQFKTLRSQVLSKLEKSGANTIMITSANPGEGKSFTSINLGVSIAQELDKTVLIVDTDLKNPAKNHYDFAKDFFNVTVEKGLADVLLGKSGLDEVLINPGIEKLTILPGGTYLHNSSELLGSPQMEQLVKELKLRYKDRIVIFDTPAILTCADPVELSKFVDSVLFVVEEDKTTADDIRRAIKLLDEKQMIGMILNKSRTT